MALHFWILDYRNDGRRRGFPFDPYLLYLHRWLGPTWPAWTRTRLGQPGFDKELPSSGALRRPKDTHRFDEEAESRRVGTLARLQG